MRAPELQTYFTHLRKLPFIDDVEVTSVGERGAGYRLELKTPGGKRKVRAELKKSHLSRELAERLIAAHQDAAPDLLLIPSVGREMGDRFEQANVNFVDLAGNCYVNLRGRYVARLQGRRPPPRATAQKAMRAPAYRALFAVLADPDLASVPVRALAQAAGVSRQAATDLRGRLLEMNVWFKRGAQIGWVPHAAESALDLFVSGYATTLRPQLLIGRYRTDDPDPGATEKRIAPLLKKACEFRWGGGSAAHRMLRYYRGPHTVVHLDGAPSDLPRRLRAIPDQQGPLYLLGTPGPLGLQGDRPDTAHPLLVYAELLVEGNDRAREAAQQVAERYLATDRYR